MKNSKIRCKQCKVCKIYILRILMKGLHGIPLILSVLRG